MRLLRYEMKKLLLNKSRLILLAVMFVIYALMGAFITIGGEYELSGEEKKNAQSEYAALVDTNSGKLNPTQLAESQSIFHAALAEYGRGEELNMRLNRDPVLKFHSQYAAFGQSVETYWNGPDEQDKDNLLGVYPIQEKLKELEAAGQGDTYEYRFYQDRLDKELSIGEPVFSDAKFWNYFSVAFDSMILTLFLMMVFPFFISPLFTQEVKTEMDSIVLCSVKGRREIVTAKLLSAALTSAIIAIVYCTGWFIGTYVGYGDLSGFDAPARGLGGFEHSMLELTIGGTVALGWAWLILAAMVFGLALSFISAKMKNQSAAFGIGIVVLLSGIFSNSLGSSIRRWLWPIMDFNFGSLSLFATVFGGEKMYNVLGTPVSYGTVAFVAGLALAAAACLFTYLAQRKRSVI